MLDIKDILPYSYLNLNDCLLRLQKINVCLTTGIEVTFELITCDSHSQEMSFISYLFVHLLLMSSHREISLNWTLLRHASIFFFRLSAFDSEIWKAKIGCFHTYINSIFMSCQVTSISQCDFCIPWLHIVHIVYFVALFFIMILLSIYIYNWIGNKFLQLTSPSPYKYINNINKTNQMTANVQAMSIIISKLSKIMSN